MGCIKIPGKRKTREEDQDGGLERKQRICDAREAETAQTHAPASPAGQLSQQQALALLEDQGLTDQGDLVRLLAHNLLVRAPAALCMVLPDM